MGPARLLTLTGPGGVGKTTLAQHLLHDLAAPPSGVRVEWFDAARLTRPEELVPALAFHLRLRPAPDADPLPLLAAHLAAAPTVLVLDNLEQLHEAHLPVSALLGAAPALRLLATSRWPIGLAAERRLPLAPFPVPPENTPFEEARASEVVTLFEQYARQVQPLFELAPTTLRAVLALCRRLDGLPLAIELAARHMDVLSPEALLRLLDRQGTLPLEGEADRPERHRSLDALLESTYALLSEEERRVFRVLGVFEGFFDFDDVGAVLNDGGVDVTRVLLKFARSGLAVPRPGEMPAFRLLETVRVFARGLLARGDGREREAVEAAHARRFHDRLTRVQMGLRHEALQLAHTRKADLYRALEWFLSRPEEDLGDSLRALDLVRRLCGLWVDTGRLREGEAYLRRALARPGPPEELRVMAATMLGSLLSMTGQFAEALELADRVEPELPLIVDTRRRLSSLNNLAVILVNSGDIVRARGVFERVLAFAQELGEPEDQLDLYRGNLVNVHMHLGEQEAALAQLLVLVPNTRRRGDVYAFVHMSYMLALVEHILGRLDEAEEVVREALAVPEREGLDVRRRNLELLQLGIEARRDPTPDTAARLRDAYVEGPRLGDNKVTTHHVMLGLGFALVHLGRYGEALELADEGLAKGDVPYDDHSARLAHPRLLRGLALLGLGREADAEQVLEVSLAEDARRLDPIEFTFVLVALAELRARRGREDEARAFLAQEDELVRAQRLVRWPILQIRLDAVRRLLDAPVVPAGSPSASLPVPVPVALPVALPVERGGLSAREAEVLALLARGLTNKQIGRRLDLSENTVRAHTRNLFQKLGARTRTEAVAIAARLGLLHLDPAPWIETPASGRGALTRGPSRMHAACPSGGRDAPPFHARRRGVGPGLERRVRDARWEVQSLAHAS